MTDTPVSDEELFPNPEDQTAYEEFCATQEREAEFQLDKPALVCRWRMAKRAVPMLNRHIRALSQRRVSGEPLSTNMLSWAKQHVEWSLDAGVYDDPNGVLMLVIDVNGNAAMTVGNYEPLADASMESLLARAETARTEQLETGVAPEVLCRIENGTLYMGTSAEEDLCGTMTLIKQLAEVRAHQVEHEATPAEVASHPGTHFLVSDEHGVVLEATAVPTPDTEAANFLAAGLSKLYK